MKATFTCATCGGVVGYDVVAVETHKLRQYGVNHYACTEPCATCDTEHEPIHMLGSGHGFQPEDAPHSQQAAGVAG